MAKTIICELICSPVGQGISVSEEVKAAITALRGVDGIRVQTHPMGTVFETETLDKVFEATKIAHEAIFSSGAQRVVTQLRIDDRRDTDRKMEDKVNAIQ